MIYELNKDITTIEYGIVTHGVNCVYKMGSGVALAIKNKWPTVYEQYMRYKPPYALLGTTDFVEINHNLFVANCYTQPLPGPHASLEAISSCLEDVFRFAQINEMTIWLPKIGCGLGGLNWKDVYPIIKQWDEEFQGNLNVGICYID